MKVNSQLSENFNPFPESYSWSHLETEIQTPQHSSILPEINLTLQILEIQSSSIENIRANELSLYITLENEFFTKKTFDQSQNTAIRLSNMSHETLLQKQLEIIVQLDKGKQTIKLGQLKVPLSQIISSETCQEPLWLPLMNNLVQNVGKPNFDLQNNLGNNNSNASQKQINDMILLRGVINWQSQIEIERISLEQEIEQQNLNVTFANQNQGEQLNNSKNLSQTRLQSKYENNLHKTYSKIKQQRQEKYNLNQTQVMPALKQINNFINNQPQSLNKSVSKANIPTAQISIQQSDKSKTPIKNKKSNKENRSKSRSKERTYNSKPNAQVTPSTYSRDKSSKSKRKLQSEINSTQSRVDKISEKSYQEYVKQVKLIKTQIKQKILPQILLIQKSSFQTQTQKIQVLKKLEILLNQSNKLCQEQNVKKGDLNQICIDMSSENTDQSEFMSNTQLKLKESLKYLEVQLLDLNSLLSETINHNSKLNLQETECFIDKRELIQLQKQRVNWEQEKESQSQITFINRNNLNEIKEDELYQMIRLQQQSGKIQSLIDKTLQEKGQLENDMTIEKYISDKQSMINEKLESKQTVINDEIAIREQELVNTRQNKRLLLKQNKDQIVNQRSKLLGLNQTIQDLKHQMENMKANISKNQQVVSAIQNNHFGQKINQKCNQDQILFDSSTILSNRISTQDTLLNSIKELESLINLIHAPQHETLIDIFDKLGNLSNLMREQNINNYTEEDKCQLNILISQLDSQISDLQGFNNIVMDSVVEQEIQIQKQAFKQLQQQSDINHLKSTIDQHLSQELHSLKLQITQQAAKINLFTRERNLYLKKLGNVNTRYNDQINKVQINNQLMTDKQKQCLEQDLKIQLMRQKLDSKLRDKNMYKGNGDRKDQFDQFVVQYFRDHQIYAIGETINVQPSLYILGCKGKAVKLKQAGEKLMVQVNDSKTMQIEKYIQQYMPKEYQKLKMIKPDVDLEIERKSKSQKSLSKSHSRQKSIMNSNEKQQASTIHQIFSQARQKSKPKTLLKNKSLGSIKIDRQAISNYLRNGDMLMKNSQQYSHHQSSGATTERGNMSFNQNNGSSFMLTLNNSMHQQNEETIGNISQISTSNNHQVKQCLINL